MPILISTPQDLDNIRNNLIGDYELVNDIDMSSWGNFNPIGNSSNKFKGHIDGKGFKIKNLTINVSTANIGFIAYLENGSVQNLSIENANVTSNVYNNVGILVGSTNTGAIITGCYTTGSVSGQYGIGGLVGWVNAGTIENCFSQADVTGNGRVGGLVGHGAGSNSIINKSYSSGLVTVNPDPNLYNGGLVGSHNSPTAITNSYWDIEKSGQTISAGGTGLTTTQMKTQSSYVGWDFTNTWGINNDYPYLQVFGVEIPPAKIETINVGSYLNTIQTLSEHHIATLRQIESYLSPINTNVTKSTRSVRSSAQSVTSFINPISASVERQTKTFKYLLSHLKPLQADLSVLYHISNRVVNGYVSVLENPSSVIRMENMTNVSYIINPSSLEVIE